MTTTLRPDSCASSKVLAGWTMTGLSCLLASAVFASEPADSGAAEHQASTSFQVSQSTPIDKVVQTVYAKSPLNTQLLRQALIDANPKVITGNPQQRVKAGTVLNVPDHSQLVRNALTPFAPIPDKTDSGPVARDYTIRRPWVRFP